MCTTGQTHVNSNEFRAIGIPNSHALPKSRDLLSFESENANMAVDKFLLTVD